MNDKELFAFMIQHFQVVDYEIRKKEKKANIDSLVLPFNKTEREVGICNEEFTLDNIKLNKEKWNEIASDSFIGIHRESKDCYYYKHSVKTMWNKFVEDELIELTYDICKFLLSIQITLGDWYEKEYEDQSYCDYGQYSYKENGLKAFHDKHICNEDELEKILLDKELLHYFFTYDFFNQEVVDFAIKQFFSNLSIKEWKNTLSSIVDLCSHNFVDLGLSIFGATCNLGANEPTDIGSSFIWGRPYSSVENDIIHVKDIKNEYYKSPINITRSRFDAAFMNWGGSWRMPTPFECKELINKCVWKKVEKNLQMIGWQVTGPNGNSIFLPYEFSRSYLTSMRHDSFPYVYGFGGKWVDLFLGGNTWSVIRPVMDKIGFNCSHIAT